MSDNFTYKYQSGAEVTLKSTEDATVTPAVHTMHVNVDSTSSGDTAIGDTDDGAAIPGGEGTVSAKLRQISADVDYIKDIADMMLVLAMEAVELLREE